MRPRLDLALAGLVLLAVALTGCFKPAPSASNDLVSDDKYTKLHVEIDYADGNRPRADAVNLLKQRIGERLSKPGGTEVSETVFTPTKTSYSNEDLKAVEAQHRQRQPSGDTMVLYVLYLNGHHAKDTGNEKVLGVQYGRASIAIFKNTIETSGGLLGINMNAADVERSVLIHEFGHAIGLVNNGLEMVRNHEDAEHPKHSSNKNSVMYWAVETTLLSQFFSGPPPTNFDNDDIADIRHGGGK